MPDDPWFAPSMFPVWKCEPPLQVHAGGTTLVSQRVRTVALCTSAEAQAAAARLLEADVGLDMGSDDRAG